MTYRELAAQIETFNDEHLDCEVTIFDSADDCYHKVTDLDFSVESKLIADNVPVLQI